VTFIYHPTDEKTKVVLPAEVPDDLPLPSDQKRPVEELQPKGNHYGRPRDPPKNHSRMDGPSEGQATDRRTGGGIRQKAVQQNEFHRSRPDPDQKFRRDIRRSGAAMGSRQGHDLEGDQDRETVGNPSQSTKPSWPDTSTLRSETGDADQPETAPATYAATDALIAEMRGVITDLRADQDAWREQAQRLALPAPKPVEQPPLGWWAWLRSTG
jgi:hypothetical protein